MKICYINPTNNIRRPIAELSEILARQDYNVTIMYPFSKECPTRNWLANETIQQKEIRQEIIPSRYLSALRYSLPRIWPLLKATRKMFRQHDIVHIWEYYYPISIIPLLYAFLSGNRKKVILTTDGFVGYSYQPKKPRWLVPAFKLYTKLFARFLFKIAPCMTTYGNAMLPAAQKAGVPPNKLLAIPTGIHLERFKDTTAAEKEKLRQELSIKDEFVIIFVGMLTERKGVETVISISRQFLDAGYNIKTFLIGDAHGENHFLKKVSVRYQDRIIFTGGRKDIPAFMRIAHVLLLPSEGEGLPGVVMEAMAAGLPVVATDEGCTPDLITSGKEGFLVHLKDHAGYYQAIKQLLDQKELAGEMSRKAQEKIALFQWENVAVQYQKLYEGFISEKQGGMRGGNTQ